MFPPRNPQVDRGRVTELILPRNNVSGEIPHELGMLSFLEELRLHRNSLRGEIFRGKLEAAERLLQVARQDTRFAYMLAGFAGTTGLPSFHYQL